MGDGFPGALGEAEPMLPSHSPEPNGSSLCLACGLCCSGVLHCYAVIKPGEIDRVRAMGLTIVPFRGALGFPLPCHLYREDHCSVYAETRPDICGAYQCDLLRRYLAGALTLEQCRRTVQRMRELLADVIPQLPAGYSFAKLRQEFDENWDCGPGVLGSAESRQANLDLLLAVTKLARYSRKHFGASNESKAK
jgi:hypothetical protein